MALLPTAIEPYVNGVHKPVNLPFAPVLADMEMADRKSVV